MVVSQNQGTLTQTPTYYNRYYGEPQRSTPNVGKPPSKFAHVGLDVAGPYSGSRRFKIKARRVLRKILKGIPKIITIPKPDSPYNP